MHDYSRMTAIRVSSVTSRIDLESDTEFGEVLTFDNHADAPPIKKISRFLPREDCEATRDKARTCAMESRISRLILERLARGDALVEFFAHSKESLRILRLLATKRNPVGFKAMMNKFHVHRCGRSDVHELPDYAVRGVLKIMTGAGVVRLTRHGCSITETGREVYQRMEPWMCLHTAKFRAVRSLHDSRPELRGACANLTEQSQCHE